MLDTSIVSFLNNVLKEFLHQGRLNSALCCEGLTPYPTRLCFHDPEEKDLRKKKKKCKKKKKKKMIAADIFFFCHNVFNCIIDKSCKLETNLPSTIAFLV